MQTVTDTKGNVYLLAAGPTSASGFGTQSIYYAQNIAAANANGNTVTVTFDKAVAFPDLRIAEYKGIATTNALDVAVGASGNSSSTSSSGGNTKVATSTFDLIFKSRTLAVSDPQYKDAVTAALAPIQSDSRIVNLFTPYNVPTAAAAQSLTSTDGHEALVLVTINTKGQAAWAVYNDAVPNARGRAKEREKQAEAYAFRRINEAKGEAQKFSLLLTEYRKAPEITRRRLYLEAMQAILPNLQKKVIVDDSLKGILQTLPLLPPDQGKPQ